MCSGHGAGQVLSSPAVHASSLSVAELALPAGVCWETACGADRSGSSTREGICGLALAGRVIWPRSHLRALEEFHFSWAAQEMRVSK